MLIVVATVIVVMAFFVCSPIVLHSGAQFVEGLGPCLDERPCGIPEETVW